VGPEQKSHPVQATSRLLWPQMMGGTLRFKNILKPFVAGTQSESVSESVEVSARRAGEGATRSLGISHSLRILLSGILTASALSFVGASWSTGASASAKNLAPIKIFETADVNDPTTSEPGAPYGAKAAVADVNRHGGINGHKLDLTFCDAAAESTLALSCARQAVSDKVVATVGSHESFGSLTFPIYKAAGIPMVGLYPSTTNPDMVSPISYPLWGGPVASLEAAVLALKKQGLTKIGIAPIDLTVGTSYIPALKPYIAKVGSQFVGSVAIPPTATDMSSYVEQLHSDGAQVVLMVLSGQEDTQMFQAADQLNIHDITWVALPLVTENDLASTPAGTKFMTFSPYPPFRSAKQYPGVAQWLADLKAINAPTGSLYTSTNGFNSWLAVMAFAKIAKTIPGPITSQSVTAALNRQKSGINLYGLVNWQPGKSGPSTSPRSANGLYYEVVFRNGQLLLASPQPVDAYKEEAGSS
jgi:branched-chain amino acid transport system substrate-binding protein